MLTPSTTTRFASGSTRVTSPRLPRSLPAMMTTSSPRADTHLRSHFSLLRCVCERHYNTSGARETIFIKFFSRNSRATGTEDARSARVVLVGHQNDRGIVVELDCRSVRTAVFLRRPHHDRTHDIALFYSPAGVRLLHGCDDNIADAAIFRVRSLEHANNA